MQDLDEAIQKLIGMLDNFNLDGSKSLSVYLDKLRQDARLIRLVNEPQDWKIRVRINEVKFFTAPNQKVYFVVQIGNNEFKTMSTLIQELRFTSKDESCVFVDLIQNKKLRDFLNFKISILVYFNKFFNQLVGKFSTDFHTIYNYPGKWNNMHEINFI